MRIYTQDREVEYIGFSDTLHTSQGPSDIIESDGSVLQVYVFFKSFSYRTIVDDLVCIFSHPTHTSCVYSHTLHTLPLPCIISKRRFLQVVFLYRTIFVPYSFFFSIVVFAHGVAMISVLLKIIGLFCRK